MDDFLNAVLVKKPYTLSPNGAKHGTIIPTNVLKFCATQDMFVIDFLYQSYRKKLNGIILNVENDFNPQLQVSIFLEALHNVSNSQHLVLVLCPDDAIIKWHYYMAMTCGTYKTEIVTSEPVQEKVNEDRGIVMLLSFSNIKLVESLMEYNFFSVIIDRFDEVASRMVIRKLESRFNIGITYRNFYTQPEQKLQWTMLNWANLGCVGKLADFYEADNDNFANFRDNYKEWWFRITWNFCDSFVKPTLEEKGNLTKALRQWANQHNLSKFALTQSERKPITRKRKETVVIKKEDSDEEILPKRARNVYNKTTNNKNIDKIPWSTNKLTKTVIKIPEIKQEINSSDDSSDTIIYGDFSPNSSDNESEKDEPSIGHKIKEEKPKTLPENMNCDFNDDESMSSGEQLLFSFVNDEKPNSRGKIKKHVNSEIRQVRQNIDDDSDMFLKSVAAKDDIFTHNISAVLNEGDSESDSSSSIDIELSEQRILGIIPAEGDRFLREICGETNRVDENTSGMVNNNYAGTSISGVSDVDTLVAEVMEIVRK